MYLSLARSQRVPKCLRLQRSVSTFNRSVSRAVYPKFRLNCCRSFYRRFMWRLAEPQKRSSSGRSVCTMWTATGSSTSRRWPRLCRFVHLFCCSFVFLAGARKDPRVSSSLFLMYGHSWAVTDWLANPITMVTYPGSAQVVFTDTLKKKRR